ncbi:MAG: hypothetical protein EOO16_05210 [Chitinophagaceae bacterium]|nr:MAG: hypothetical protein EOO16_05210 [Chitinophagaceae bacterium]
MKNTFFRSTVAAALLAVGVVGCAPLQQASGDDYYDPSAPRVSTAPSRVWVDDPYRPGSSILMERDPFSGRYYPVASPYNSYGRVYNSPYGAYDPYYGSGGYGHPRSGGGRRGGSYRQQAPAPSPQQREQVRREGEQRRQEAADAILGRKQ